MLEKIGLVIAVAVRTARETANTEREQSAFRIEIPYRHGAGIFHWCCSVLHAVAILVHKKHRTLIDSIEIGTK